MENKNNRINMMPFIMGMFGLLMIMGFVFRHFVFIFFMAVMMAVLIGSIYFFIKYWRDQRIAKDFDNSMEGSITQNLELCKGQISKNQKEMVEIRESINELNDSLDDKMHINENTMFESELLIQGFERELDLRKAKLDFYNICLDKIKNIQFNQRLVQKLANKKDKLKRLQEEHFEDLAEMERLRSDMDYNKSYMDTINRLSLKMAESTSLSSAQELHDELKLITKELRDL